MAAKKQQRNWGNRREIDGDDYYRLDARENHRGREEEEEEEAQ